MDSFDMVYSACMIVIQGSSWLTRMNLTRLLRYGLTNSFRKFKSVKTLTAYVEQLVLPGKLTEKALSLIQNGFNDQTDELLAAGCQIHKMARSRAISTAISEWNKYLISFFPSHLPSHDLPLHWLFDLYNHIVLENYDSFIPIGGSLNQPPPLSKFIPMLTQ